MKISEMSRVELASYCASLLTLMSSKEDAGIARGQTLGEEYTNAYDRLSRIIKGEEDETGKREQSVRGDSASNDQSQREPRLHSSDRESRGTGESRGADVHRSGSGSA